MDWMMRLKTVPYLHMKLNLYFDICMIKYIEYLFLIVLYKIMNDHQFSYD